MQLITGGLGFIGRHTARALLEMGEPCVLTRHQSTPEAEIIAPWMGKQAFIEPLDVANRDSWLEIGKRHRITGIIHLAGPALSITDPFRAAALAVDGLLNALFAAREWGGARVSVASTIGVYGGAFTETLREEAPLPLSAAHVIPATKKVYEVLCSYVGASAGLQVACLRLSAIWGPLGRADSPFFPLPRMIHAAAKGTAPAGARAGARMYAEDGMDLCYVKDCAAAISRVQLARTLNHAVYNVGFGRAVTNREVAAAISRAAPGASFDLAEGFDPAGPRHTIGMDISRLRDDTGFSPSFSVEAGIEDYVSWLRSGHER